MQPFSQCEKKETSARGRSSCFRGTLARDSETVGNFVVEDWTLPTECIPEFLSMSMKVLSGGEAVFIKLVLWF